MARVPDEYRTERVVDPSYEDMLELAIRMSIQESVHTQTSMKEVNEKRTLFSSLVDKTKRIGIYDKEIKELHTILQEVIDEYCKGRKIKQHVKEYILNTIQQIRLTTTELQLIHSIL